MAFLFLLLLLIILLFLLFYYYYFFCACGCTLDNHHDGQKPELSIITSFERFFVTSLKLRWCFKRLVA